MGRNVLSDPYGPLHVGLRFAVLGVLWARAWVSRHGVPRWRFLWPSVYLAVGITASTTVGLSRAFGLLEPTTYLRVAVPLTFMLYSAILFYFLTDITNIRDQRRVHEETEVAAQSIMEKLGRGQRREE